MTKGELITMISTLREPSLLRDIISTAMHNLPDVAKREMAYLLHLKYKHQGKFVVYTHVDSGTKFYAENMNQAVKRIQEYWNPKADRRNVNRVIGTDDEAYGFTYRYETNKEVIKL